MRNAAMMASCLLALAAPSWGQQNGKDKSGTTDAREIRAYLVNKDRQPVDIAGITAVLLVEGKDGAELRIPLQAITPKAEEKSGLQSSTAPREVEGTKYFASLIAVPPYGNRRSESEDADRRLAKGSIPEPQLRQEPELDRNRFALEGPYFKADLTREQLGAFTCRAAVQFTVNGEARTAKGFSCTLTKGGGTAAERCPRLAEDCNQVERHLKAGEMDKAGSVVDRLSASLCEPCGEVSCRRARHGCASCCKDLRAAISAGIREKALAALEALKSQCSPCSPSEIEPRTNGDRK